MEVITCSGCFQKKDKSQFHSFLNPQRKKTIASKCKDCRSQEYYQSRYFTKCNSCLKYRPVGVEKMCRKCLEKSGIRECTKCKKPLPLYLMFYGRSRVCKICRRRGGVKTSTNAD